jgi:hypothetical protein
VKRPKTKQPTQRTLEECRKRGWTAGVVERWIAAIQQRKDLFGFGDVLVLDGKPGSLLIQATSQTNVSSRIRKVLSIAASWDWLRAGNRISVWGWEGVAFGERKRWHVTENPIILHRNRPGVRTA